MIKLLASGLMIIIFFTAVALSSCNPRNTGSEEAEQETEHPSGDPQEDPSGQEHPSDQEHQADTVSGSGEHPTN